MRNILNNWYWKQAEQLADDPAFAWEKGCVAEAMAPHLKRANVKGAKVYRGAKGGWIGDVVFKNMPPGFADTLGTSVAHPHQTEKEAYRAVVNILAGVICAERQEKPAGYDGTAVFPFHDLLIHLVPSVFEELEQKCVPTDGGDFRRTRLAEAEELLDGDFSPEKFASLDRELQDRFMVAIYCARREGIMRWPETQICAPAAAHFQSATIH